MTNSPQERPSPGGERRIDNAHDHSDEHAGSHTQLVHKTHVADIARLLAHRIRSLTTCIEAYGDLLGDTLAQPEQRDLLFRIFESTARIEHILSDLLLFSRPMQAAFSNVSLATVVENVRITVGDDFDERIELSKSLDAGTEMRCDERLLRQALLALIKNAMEAGPHGAKVLMAVEPGPEADSVVFTVENEGTLTEGATEQMVFEPFFSTKPRNLGLGLSLARQIARKHGGTVTLHANDEAQTVRVSMTVPLRPAEKAARPAYEA